MELVVVELLFEELEEVVVVVVVGSSVVESKIDYIMVKWKEEAVGKRTVRSTQFG